MDSELPRRGLLICAGATAICTVTGCSPSVNEPTAAPSAAPPVKPNTPSPTPAAPVTPKVTDVPVGGGILVDAGDGVIVTQPTAGQFKAFSAVCPHEGCTVSEIRNGDMICPCHGSRFRISDGVVTRGPARQGLDPVPFTIANGVITVEPESAPPPSFSG